MTEVYDGEHDPIESYIDHADGESTLIIKQGDDRVHVDIESVPQLVSHIKRAAGIAHVIPVDKGGNHAKRA